MTSDVPAAKAENFNAATKTRGRPGVAELTSYSAASPSKPRSALRTVVRGSQTSRRFWAVDRSSMKCAVWQVRFGDCP
jgi:hypothetical protein